MRRPLTPGQSRALALVLLFAVLAGIAALIYLPWQAAHRRYDEAIADRLDRTARYLRIAAQRGDVEKNIALIKKRNAGRFYLKASAPALAASEIQQTAQAIVEANELKVESTQFASHKDEGTHRKVTVNFRLRGTLAAVQKTLYELETAMPYLYVDNLTVRSAAARSFKAAPGVEPDMLVQFDLYAFARVADSAVRKP